MLASSKSVSCICAATLPMIISGHSFVLLWFETLYYYYSLLCFSRLDLYKNLHSTFFIKKAPKAYSTKPTTIYQNRNALLNIKHDLTTETWRRGERLPREFKPLLRPEVTLFMKHVLQYFYGSLSVCWTPSFNLVLFTIFSNSQVIFMLIEMVLKD